MKKISPQGDNSSVMAPFSQLNPVCVKLTKKTNQNNDEMGSRSSREGPWFELFTTPVLQS